MNAWPIQADSKGQVCSLAWLAAIWRDRLSSDPSELTQFHIIDDSTIQGGPKSKPLPNYKNCVKSY